MKFNKTNLIKLKRESNNRLEKRVIDYLLNNWGNYDKQSKVLLVHDILNFGCVSGVVTDLIYYKDTLNFYKKYNIEINSLLNETLKEYGLSSPSSLFGDKWDNTDPMALDISNRNLLAWFGFEKALEIISTKFEEFWED